MFGNQFIYGFDPETNLDEGMVLNHGYLLGGSYHGNDSIFLLNCYGVRWQVEVKQTYANAMSIVGPAWSDFAKNNITQDVKCLHFIEEGEDMFYVATYNKYGLETHGYRQKSLVFWWCLLSVTHRSRLALAFPLVFVIKLYSTSQTNTVDFFIKDRECEVFIGKIPSVNRPNTFSLSFYGPDWSNMMDELAIRPGQFFALTHVRRGKFSLTVFNTKGKALTACENYASYVFPDAIYHIGQQQDYELERMGWYCTWRCHTNHSDESRAFYLKLTQDVLIIGRIRISKGFVDRHKLRGYNSAVVNHKDEDFEFTLCKKSKSIEMFSTTALRDMVKYGFWCGQLVRFYLIKDNSLEDGVVRFEVC